MSDIGLRIVLVRHGESVWNASGQWQGQANPPLSDTGVAQSEKVAARLASMDFDVIVTSDLVRALQTAQLVAAAHGLVPEARAGFRELDVGVWAGHTSAEIAELFPDEWAGYVSGADPRRGGGESLGQLNARVCGAFDLLIADAGAQKWQTIGIVTHGGVVRALAMRALGLDGAPRRRPGLAPPANTALAEILYGSRGLRLVRYNDDSHLAAAADTALDT